MLICANERGEHAGTEPGTAAMLYGGAIAGVLLRGTTWVLTARSRLPVRLLCVPFVLDALGYLTPIVAFADMGFVEITTSAWALFAVAVVGNLGLAGLALLIIIRSRAPRSRRWTLLDRPVAGQPRTAS
jgi:hypothetical protein